MNSNQSNSAFLLVDYQNDFVDPAWALYVKWAEQINESIKQIISIFREKNIKTIASKDWHPKNHISFASSNWLPPFSQQWDSILWPDHCVQNEKWSQLYGEMKDENFDQIILKAYKENEDAYSAFKGTFLDEYLRANKIKNLFIWWVATDYCVDQSIVDAVNIWYNVFVLQEAIKAVFPEKEAQIIKRWKTIWVRLITIDQLKKIFA